MRLLMCLMLAAIASIVPATAEDRSLTLHHTHTGKSATIVFKRDGKFDPQGLSAVNALLADWRNGKQTEMDPALLDLLWSVYQDVGATNAIHIVSSYRSPETNKMLREKSSGVAENSQHMRGKAMDFFIPGVRLDVLRAAAMRRQGGGVGFYPTSGSPFVHLDTGSVRAWPRMTTAQLATVFPDGNTSHLPSDGPALPRQNVQVAALAVPQASPTTATTRARPKTLVDMLFGGKQSPGAAAMPNVQVASIQPPAAEERLAPTDAALPMAAELDTSEPRKIPPYPRPRPTSLFPTATMALASLGASTPTVGIDEQAEPYKAMAYAPMAPAVSSDPFSFVHALPVQAEAVRKHIPEGVPAQMLVAVPMDRASSLQWSPDLQDIGFLVAPPASDPISGFVKPAREIRRF